MYILCIHLYIHVYTAGGECYVLGNGQLKAFMNISRVQGRSRRCLTRVNPHHHHQSRWSQGEMGVGASTREAPDRWAQLSAA